MVKTPFIPPKLPPKIDFSSLIKEIGQAHDALGKLNGSLLNIPNPDLLTTPLLTKEAVLSSRIEGTQATLKDVFEYEAEAKSSEKSVEERDVREILNYRRAMDAAIEELAKKPIGENLLKKTHNILLDSVRGTHKDRGNFRKAQVYIGPHNSKSIEDATYVPPNPAEILPLLGNWEMYINSDKEEDLLVQIGVAHYQFEAIHPFMDGNGRIGRLLIPLFLYQRNLLSHPLLYISEYFEKDRNKYYSLLNGVSKDGAWENWLKFFLNGVTEQSLRAQTTVLKILVLYNKLKVEITQANAVHAVSLLDVIFASPIVSFTSIKKRIRARSYQTIYNLLAKFVKLGILSEIPERKRNRIYVFKQLLDILK
ncbi:MAG: Fic family protein [Candidatus Omnitrophota bacterium]